MYIQTKTNQNKYNTKLGLNKNLQTSNSFFCIYVFVFFDIF